MPATLKMFDLGPRPLQTDADTAFLDRFSTAVGPTLQGRVVSVSAEAGLGYVLDEQEQFSYPFTFDVVPDPDSLRIGSRLEFRRGLGNAVVKIISQR